MGYFEGRTEAHTKSVSQSVEEMLVLLPRRARLAKQYESSRVATYVLTRDGIKREVGVNVNRKNEWRERGQETVRRFVVTGIDEGLQRASDSVVGRCSADSTEAMALHDLSRAA